jgi:hypothetical protein
MGDRAKEVEASFREVFMSKLTRDANEFGMSQAGFCLDRLRLEKIYMNDLRRDANGNMVVGTLFHQKLKPLIKGMSYGKAHLPKKWYDIKGWVMAYINRPRYERIVRYEHEDGFKIGGHCDCDLPALDKIIEFKTTGSTKPLEQSDELLSAYILQANAYAYRLGRKEWELWVVYKGFQSVYEPFVTIISGPTSEDDYIRFIERIQWVWYAIQHGGELNGPEMDWECNSCGVKQFCEKIKKKYSLAVKILPCSRNKFIDTVGESAFKLFYRKKWIVYDANLKIYHISPSFKEEYGL